MSAWDARDDCQKATSCTIICQATASSRTRLVGHLPSEREGTLEPQQSQKLEWLALTSKPNCQTAQISEERMRKLQHRTSGYPRVLILWGLMLHRAAAPLEDLMPYHENVELTATPPLAPHSPTTGPGLMFGRH